MTLLSINNLTITAGTSKILDTVNLDIPAGSIFGLVGGSGSGKTTLGLALLNMLPPAMRLQSGHIKFDGKDLLTLPPSQLRRVRGRDIGMVFQEPLSAFDPLFTVGAHLDETLQAHADLNAEDRRRRCLETLQAVELEDPQRIYNSYSHQLSGGQRQRAMIAQAIICRPKLVLADEPTSSLDVTVQARIVKLLRSLNASQGITVLLISHDLALVGHLAAHAAVMQQGRVVEQGPVKTLLTQPKDPYTKQLTEAST